MTDVDTVEHRLRNFAQGCRGSMWQSRDETIYLMDTAADEIARLKATIAALPPAVPDTTPDPVSEAAKVLLNDTTIADKVEMNHAGVAAMFPSGWEVSQKIAFDKGRIAALRALTKDGEAG